MATRNRVGRSVVDPLMPHHHRHGHMQSPPLLPLVRAVLGAASSVLLLACSRSQGPAGDRGAESAAATGAAPTSGVAEGAARAQIQATSSFRAWHDSANQCRSYRTVNQTFIQGVGFVLLESSDVTWCETIEGSRAATITVQRWQDDSLELAPRYRFEARGEEGRRLEELFEVTSGMSGGGDDEYSYFSIETGAQVFESNTPVIRVSMNRVPWRRYLALTPGSLQYGDGTRPSTRVGISGMEGSVDDYCVSQFGFVQPGDSKLSDSLRLTSTVDPRGPMPVPDFTVRAELEGCWDSDKAYWVEIPVTGDRLAIERARTSDGIRITAAPTR